MTNTDFDVDYDPGMEDSYRRLAQQSTMGAMNVVPEEAARSSELSKATGVPAPLVNVDVENFEKQHKLALNNKLIQQNQHLQDYFNLIPNAAEISHDDVGQLDELSETTKPFLQRSPLEILLGDKAFETFTKGFGDEPIGSSVLSRKDIVGRPSETEWAFANKELAAVGIGLASLAEIPARTINGIMAVGHERIAPIIGEQAANDLFGYFQMEMSRGDIGVRAGGGGITQASRRLGMYAKISREGLPEEPMAPPRVEPKFGEGEGVPEGTQLTKDGRLRITRDSPAIKAVADLTDAVNIADRWGGTPPPGVHPLIDKFHQQQAREDGAIVDKIFQAARKTQTGELSPDHLSDFLGVHFGTNAVRIDGEAALKLYGDKPPAEDDGILGWVPDIQAQLDAAKLGHDVIVPLKDWIAKGQDVYKDLKDDIAYRDNGMSINETKIEAESKGSVDDSVAQVRAAGGLEPLAMAGDRKVTLQRRAPPEDQPEWMKQGKFHDVDILDENGNAVGTINLSEQKDGKRIYIEDIQAGTEQNQFYQPNFLGPALVKDIKRQLKAMFPNAETITGHRATGARYAGRDEKYLPPQGISMPEVKLQLGDDPQALRDLLQPYWEQVHPYLQAEILPEEALTPEARQARDAIVAELKRIAPNVDSRVVNSIFFPKAGKRAQGAFAKDIRKLFVALDSKDPIGTTRHEVIHALRQMNFIREDEWRDLLQASKEGNWREKYGIDKRWKGYDLTDEQLDEEAIAEHYRYWRRGEDITDPGGIFQRIRDFIDSVHRQLKQHFGGDLSWEEIFKEIDAGRVGRRELSTPIRPIALKRVGWEPLDKAPDFIKEELSHSPDDTVRHFRRAANDNLTKLEQRRAEGQIEPEGYDDMVDKMWSDFGSKLKRGNELLDQMQKLIDKGTLSEIEQARYDKLAKEHEGLFPPTDEPLAMANVEQFRKAANDNYLTPEEKEMVEDHLQALRSGREAVSKLTEEDVDKWNKIVEEILQHEGKDQPLAMASSDETPGFGLYDRAKAIGLDQAHVDRVSSLLNKRNEEDFKASLKRAQRQITRESNREYKAHRVSVQDEVRQAVEARPDIAMDRIMQQGKIKFDPAHLTEAQRDVLPKDYIQKKDGVNPDDIAGNLGFASGDALVERLAMLTENRRRANMSLRDYVNRLVDSETDRRMGEEYGDRQADIMDRAIEQAISETQVNMVHEDTLRFAQMAGKEPPLSKNDVRYMVKKAFDKLTVKNLDPIKMLQKMGTLGRKIEQEASKGNWDKVLRQSQAREYVTQFARLAADYRRERKALDKTAKQFRKREVGSVPQEYTNWVHDLLDRAGYQVPTSDLDTRVGRFKEQTLGDFINAKEAEWMGKRELPVADWIRDPTFRKNVDDMTHEEFRDFKAAIDGIVKAGRDEQKIYFEGETFDRKQLIGMMVNQLVNKFSKNKFVSGYEPGKAKRFLAGSQALGTVFRRFDGGDRYGLWGRITNRMAEADNAQSRIEREVAKEWREVMKDAGDLSKIVDKPPELRNWDYGSFTRENLLALVHAAGNESNWNKTAKGWGADPSALLQWLIKNTTKEDWDRAQAFNDRIFQKLIGMSDNVYEHVEGVPVERIPLRPLQIRFADGRVGDYKGWYHPLFADPLKESKVSGRNSVGKFNNAAATRDGWTKARTDVVYPVDLSFSQIPAKLSEIIHDITHKEAVLDTSKIFRDQNIRQAIVDHYGPEYRDLLNPWLEDAAGQSPQVGQNMRALVQLSNTFRTNAINTYISFNPSTPMKHFPTAFLMSMQELGWKNAGRFADAYRKLYFSSGRDNWAKIVDGFEEIQRRERHWEETFGGAQAAIGGELSLAQRWNQWGSKVVAASDKFSARPLALARYLMELEEHGNAGLAREQAELSVRRAHGSTAPSNMPELVRQNRNNLGHWMTTVYGFMGERMQRLIETAHSANDSWNFVKDGEIKKAGAELFSSALPRYITYGVMVAAIEQAVESVFEDKRKQSWGSALAQVAFGHIWSSVLFGRDFASAVMRGERPSFGMFETAAKDAIQPLVDLHKGRQAFSRQQAGKTVKDLLTSASIFTGVPSKTAASAVQFGINRYNNLDRPRDLIGGYFRGITRGQSQKRQPR